MHLLGWLSGSLFAGLAYATASHPHHPEFFNNRVIFTPPHGTKASYPRIVELSDGTLLATISWRNPKAALPYFPIFQSKDDGWTWKHISNLTDDVNGLGFGSQPALAELPYKMGKYPKGTVLASGNSAGNTSTNIDLYASFNKGKKWEFVSNVARGGRPNTTNGATPIWEPFILPYEHTMGLFYSDQRDPLHGQKLAHQESKDLKDWGPVINDVAYLNYTDRPGMTSIAHIPTVDKWIFTYEFPEHAGGINWFGNQYPIYYKIANNPLDFRYADGFPLIAGDSTGNGSPYVVWSSVGGGNGTLIASDADTQDVWTNQEVGRPDKWVKRPQPGKSAYSRTLHVSRKNPDHLLIFSGATYDDTADGPQIPLSTKATPPTMADVSINKMNDVMGELRDAARELCQRYPVARDAFQVLDTRHEIMRQLNGRALVWDNLDALALQRMVACVIETVTKMGGTIQGIKWSLGWLARGVRWFSEESESLKAESEVMENESEVSDEIEAVDPEVGGGTYGGGEVCGCGRGEKSTGSASGKREGEEAGCVKLGYVDGFMDFIW
ncbi:hypothetical protein V493_05250 [Pseudogymnoascus sp. VKM F-4281 (FW-2241)]|nr:hypothetical protein V493_05250 [Pseudogymnoascus sp. VKM F-4281 (FW-2241)]